MTEFNTNNTSSGDSSLNSSLHSSEFNELFQSNSTSGSNMSSWLDCFPEIVGRSPLMMKVLETVYKISSSNSSVLINGESGTGKELIASAIHRLSPRASKKFVAINCSAIPETLLESELFGHEKGAFTGANTKRVGLFAQADGGSLFLDEIGDMPLRLQSKLLRVLQDKKFTPLGGQNIYYSDVRIITATNINLDKAVSEGKFRLDLYYRLNVLPVYIPPLRERPEDIPALLDKFLQNTNKTNLSSPSHFSPEALELLCKYPWPGNVRELQNLVERMSILSKNSVISVDNLPEKYKNFISIQTPSGSSFQERPLVPSAINLNSKPSSLDSFTQRSNQKEGVSSLGFGSKNGLKEESSQDSLSKSLAQDSRRCGAVSSQLNANLEKNSLANLENGKDQIQYDFSNIQLPQNGIDIVSYIEQLENHLTLQALTKTSNNKNQAAKLLGLNRTTLVERIKKRKLIQLKEPSKEL